MRTQVMLSVPLPSQSGAWTSLQIIWSNMSSITLAVDYWALRSLRFLVKKSTHCCEVRQSHMPSHAITRNLSSAVNYTVFISGTQVIIYASTGTFLFCLYSRSPNALERLKIPRTLPSSTKPPAASILLSSSVLSGLWSSDISMAVVPLARTQRLSPELAHITESFVKITTFAVQPADIEKAVIGSFDLSPFIYSSMMMKHFLSASSYCPFLYSGSFLKVSTNFFST